MMQRSQPIGMVPCLKVDGRRRRMGLLGLCLAVALMLGFVGPVMAQDMGRISGEVVDARNLQPLAGAQVYIAGIEHGGLTNLAGRFLLLDVPAGDHELRVELLGYAPVIQQVSVTAEQVVVVNLSLREQAVQLEEVVVTGTAGPQRYREVANAIAEIDAAAIVNTAPVTSVGELLTGRAAGVIVTPGTGMVGSGPKIRIRGLSSFSLSNDPLIYVDGVRVNNATGTGPTIQGFSSGVISRLNDINPEDIASIEIIKGAAAATLFGTEASNGVIQIITKKGQAGEPELGLTIRQGANWFANPEERIEPNYALISGDITELDIVDAENARGTPLFQTGHIQGYQLYLSGGNEGLRYYLSAGLDDEEGVEPTNWLNRFSGRGNFSISPTSTIDLNLSLGYTTSEVSLAREAGAGGIMWSTLFALPGLIDTPNRGFFDRPPEIEHRWIHHGQEADRFTGSVQLFHRASDWFRQRLTLGTDVSWIENETLIPKMTGDLLTFFSGQVTQGSKSIERNRVAYTTVDYSGTASFDLTDAVRAETTVGAQYYRKFREEVDASGDGFPATGVETVGSAAVTFGSDDFVENVTVGVFVQEQLSWRDRIFITGAVRADDNSAFGESFELVYYPKVSGTWVISEEPFWDIGFLDVLKLRAAYGESGQQPDAFAALRTFEPVTGPGDVPAIAPQFIGNPKLGPERSQEVELGFDAGFLDDRIGLNLTYYDARTKDAILLKETAPSTGFPGAQFVNVGEIRNSGLELLIDAVPVQGRDFGWNLAFTLATNDNQVVSLGGLEPIDFGRQRHQAGYPVGALFYERVVSAELDETGTVTNLMCDGGAENGHQPVPCDEAPRVFFGRPTPSVEGSVHSTVTLFGRLGLSVMFDFKSGNKVHDNNLRIRCQIFRICMSNLRPDNYDPVYLAYVQTPMQGGFLSDGSFTKLREVSLRYTVPERLSALLGASAASISLAARNLYTWTDYTGLDPENTFIELGNGTLPLEQNNIPPLTSFITTVNLTF